MRFISSEYKNINFDEYLCYDPCQRTVVQIKENLLPDMPERRRHHRDSRELRVRCQNSQLSFDCLTRDICPGGVFIITSHLLPPDSAIDLEFSFGGQEPAIHCRGRIAWINAGQLETFPPGFGVEFLEGDAQMMGRLLEDLGFY